MNIRYERERIRFLKMDERSLTQIMEQIAEHYDKYHTTNDAGEQFAYIFEMLTLIERLSLLWMEVNDINRTNLINNTLQVLNPNTIPDYSRDQLRCLAYVVDKLEKPEMNRVIFHDVMNRLERIVNPKQKEA